MTKRKFQSKLCHYNFYFCCETIFATPPNSEDNNPVNWATTMAFFGEEQPFSLSIPYPSLRSRNKIIQSFLNSSSSILTISVFRQLAKYRNLNLQVLL